MRNYIFTILLFSSVISNAQKEDSNWILGTGQFDLPSPIYRLNQINFDNDSFHVALLNKNNPFFGACAIVSDSSGNLLCYSNDINVYNKSHVIIQNGQEFQSSSQFSYGYPFNQSVIILPLPGKPGIYIMIDGTDLDIVTTVICNQLRYSIIDISQNNNQGAVTQKNIPINNSTDTLNLAFLTAVRHGNGKDWWLLSTKYQTNIYRKFLVSSDGIQFFDNQAIGDTVQNGVGYAAFSPSGCWYARYLTYGKTSNPGAAFYLYRFDRNTGELSMPLHKIFPKPEYNGGVAFSPNSRFLYVAKYLQILQYDLQSPDILASETVVAQYDGFLDGNGVPTRFYGLQLAPDNKIYGNVPGFNTRYLHVIDQPDLPGAACNVLQHAIYLPAYNFGTLPNLPYYRLYESTVPCDSLINAAEPPPAAAEPPAIRVWPVPAADVLYFSAPTSVPEALHLFLFDGLGRLVLDQPDLHLAPTATVPLNALPAGVYAYALCRRDGRVLRSGKVIRTGQN